MNRDPAYFPGLSPAEGGNIQASFDGGPLSSNGGLLLLRGVEGRLGVAQRLATCLRNRRAAEKVCHTVAETIRFRMFAIAAGYEDANDCGALRGDPPVLLADGAVRYPTAAPDQDRRSHRRDGNPHQSLVSNNLPEKAMLALLAGRIAALPP